MRDILITLTIFGSIPAILVKPHIGVLVWSWISYMNPHRFAWGFAYDFRFALLVGAATILAWLFSRELKRIPWSGPTFLLIALAIWVSITTIFATYPGPAAQSWERVAKILLFNGIVTLGLMQTKQRINFLIWVIVLSISFFGVKGGIFTLSTGGGYHVLGAADSFISDNNDLGLAMLTVIPLMRYLQMVSTSLAVRWGLAAAMFLSFIAILGTQSRGALIGMAVLVLLLFLKTRRRFALALGVAATLALGFAFMPDSWHARMDTIGSYEQDASAQGRIDAWGYAVDLALERPIFGGGFGAFRGHTVKRGGAVGYRVAHSIYFQVLGEHGFVGLALYLALGVSTFLMGGSIARRARDHPDLAWARDLARMLQASLATFAVVGAFLSRDFFDLVIHLVAIMILTGAIVRQAVAVKRPEYGRPVSAQPAQ
jgi:probable O-glycosylation ligase (exosortase A-associated)